MKKKLLFKNNEIKYYNINDTCEEFNGLVINIGKKYYNNSYYYELDDVIQIGRIGLIKAYNTYNIDKNILFSTYAYRCINQEILNFIRDEKRKINYDLTLNNAIDSECEDEKISLLIDYKTNIENDVNNKIILKLIQNKLNSLKERDRQIILMAIKGYKQKDIVEAINCTINIVKNVIKKFRKELNADLIV